jgi:HlyD family secretion protein
MNTDRPLPLAYRRARLVRRAGVGLLAGAGLIGVLGFGGRLLRPQVARTEIRTARVDVGPIEAAIMATGTVLPEIEQAVSLPVDARVLHIRKRPGDRVAPGEALLELDLSEARLAVAKRDQELALLANKQARTRLALLARMNDLTTQHKIKQLQLGALAAQTARDRQLHERGMVAREVLAQSELVQAQAAIELERIAADTTQAAQTTRSELQGLALEMATLRRERAEAQRQLDLATTRADRAGVVTFAVSEEGASLHKGDVIARIADLGSFRVEANISDVHAQRLRAGLPVVVKIADEAGAGAGSTLPGTISNVHPTIREGIMTFAVALANKTSALLRSNLRVDVLVLTSRKQNALRLARGPFADGDGARQVFVVRGDRAVRTSVRLGLSGPERFEVLDGITRGDEVIISDMREYLHLTSLALR